jgi:hypothetical protein
MSCNQLTVSRDITLAHPALAALFPGEDAPLSVNTLAGIPTDRTR